ncbi:MAG: hypothetical protein DHS20C01_01580 [marine bacterium B5-7]|nr:MAG: hypothetical protein DHS20C01_01580 [marine bacterium B5-7]
MKQFTHFIAGALTAVTLLSASAISASESRNLTKDDYAANASDAEVSLLQPTTWFAHAPMPGTTMEFNPAHPAGWAVMLNPRTHTSWHMAFTNPATYAQFVKPEFYMQFMNPSNWLAWFNPASYSTYLDPNTYVYWMTPHAYLHALNPDNYLQAFNLDNYKPYVDSETYAAWFDTNSYKVFDAPKGVVGGGAGVNYFSSVANFLNGLIDPDTVADNSMNSTAALAN